MNAGNSSVSVSASTTTPTPTVSSEAEKAYTTTVAAQQLRLALDDLMETTFVNTPDAIEEIKLEQFLMLVSQYNDDAIKLCITMTKPRDDDNDADADADDNDQQTSSSSWYTGRLPIHLACDKSAPIEVIRWLLDADLTKQTLRVADKWGDLPLHTICSRHGIQKNIVEIVQLLLEYDDQIVASVQQQEQQQNVDDSDTVTDKKQQLKRESCPTVFTKDNDGFLPIHMACRYQAPPDVVNLLLEHDRTPRKDSLQHPGGTYPQLPLAVACRCQASVDVIKLLLDYDTTHNTVITRDETTGRLPIHIALLRPSSVQKDTVRLLLKAMLYGRMERIGIRKWKYIMQTTILDEALQVHERDWMVREKLDTIHAAIQQFVDQTHVIELVLWKVQCWIQLLWSLEEEDEKKKQSDGKTIDAAAAISITAPLDDMVTRYEVHDLIQYKQHARHSSGWTDNVTPVIMSFLEGDVVEHVLRELWLESESEPE
jgi:hypothetical protein